jgi:hypothetical protein
MSFYLLFCMGVKLGNSDSRTKAMVSKSVALASCEAAFWLGDQNILY